MSDEVYDLALSYASEDRHLARALALALEDAGYAVFYDEFETAALWGTDLAESLGEIYGGAARYCLIIVSESYRTKAWTGHERRFAIEKALGTRTDYILPVRVDDAALPGWPGTIGYLDARDRPVASIADALFAKLGAPMLRSPSDVSAGEREVAQAILEACFRRAIFTRMDSEIQIEAMRRSITGCIGIVQPLVPRLTTPELQHVGLRILQGLDGIERSIAPYDHFSWNIPPGEKVTIDGLKLEVIQLLRRLKRRCGLTMLFPTSLAYDHFLDAEDASEPPRPQERWAGSELDVSGQIEMIDREHRGTAPRAAPDHG